MILLALTACRGQLPTDGERAAYVQADAGFAAIRTPCDRAYAAAIGAPASASSPGDPRFAEARAACLSAARAADGLAFEAPIYPEEANKLRRATAACAAVYRTRAGILARLQAEAGGEAASADPGRQAQSGLAIDIRNAERAGSICLAEYRAVAVGAGFAAPPGSGDPS